MMTGWYGIPGSRESKIKVHLIIDGLPACNSHMSDQAQFQWCADGIKFDYLECEHCKRIARRILEKESEVRNLLDIIRRNRKEV